MPLLVIVGFAALFVFTFIMALRSHPPSNTDAMVLVVMYAVLFFGLLALALGSR